MDCNHHTWHKISPAWEFLMARIVNFNHFNQPSYLMLEWLQLSSDNYQNHPLGSAKGGPGTCFGTLQRRPIWCHFGLGLPRIPGRSWAGTQTWDGFWTMICSSVVLQGIQRACGNSRNKTYDEWHLQISQVTKNKQPSTFNLQPCLKLALCSLGTGKTSSPTAFLIWVWRCRVKHWPFRLSNIFGTGEQAPCGIISSSPALPMGEASRKHLTISTVIKNKPETWYCPGNAWEFPHLLLCPVADSFWSPIICLVGHEVTSIIVLVYTHAHPQHAHKYKNTHRPTHIHTDHTYII